MNKPRFEKTPADFDRWNEAKKKIHARASVPEFAERDIWWCQIGLNVGFEQDGKHALLERPVLVLRKYSKQLFFGLPLTSVKKENIFHYQLFAEQQNSFVILSQGRVFSARRLLRKIKHISADKLGKVLEYHADSLSKKTKPQLES